MKTGRDTMAKHNGTAKDIDIRLVATSDSALASLLRGIATKVGLDAPINMDVITLVGKLDGFCRRPDAVRIARPVLRRHGLLCRRFAVKGGAIDGITSVRLSTWHDGAVAGLPVLDIRISSDCSINWEVSDILGEIDRRSFAWIMTTKETDGDGQSGLLTWGTSATITGYDNDICIGYLDDRASDRLRRHSADLIARVA